MDYNKVINNITDNGNMSISEKTKIAIKEIFDFFERKEKLSCEFCSKGKNCKILNFVYKNRLKNDGYAMHKNEFYCNQFDSLF